MSEAPSMLLSPKLWLARTRHLDLEERAVLIDLLMLIWHQSASWGKHEATLRRHQAKGRPVPALDKKPVLEPHLVHVWHDFWFLDRSRPLGFGGVGPIPFEAMDRYAARFGPHCPLRFRQWCDLLVAVDVVVMKRKGSAATGCQPSGSVRERTRR